MFALILTLTTILSALRLKRIMNTDDREVRDEEVNGVEWSLWSSILHHYGLPFGKIFISTVYAIYIRFTFVNMMFFLLKYVPTGLYMYKYLKNIYQMSRERLKERQMELEDLQLQIQIVNTKLCVRDSEFTERAEEQRRSAQRFMRVRTRVRDFISADESLRRVLHSFTVDADNEQTVPIAEHEREDSDFIMELLKALKYDQVPILEAQEEKMDSKERGQTQRDNPEISIHSSLSDGDVRQDYRVKVIKVTNVYKVACLKNYIKQKRLRRANKQALLKKKMDNIKNLLEHWQKTLNMVINNKLTIFNLDPHPMDVASQEAMGDYSKRESSDSDSDLRNGCDDMCLDEYSFRWGQNADRTYPYSNFEEISSTAVAREFEDSQDLSDSKYSAGVRQCQGPSRLSILEEFSSETGLEEINSDNVKTAECRDLISL